MHARQDHLTVALGGAPAHLFQHLLGRRTALGPPGDAHKAIGAGVVAAVLDLDQGAGVPAAGVQGRLRRRGLASGARRPGGVHEALEDLLLVLIGDEQLHALDRGQQGVVRLHVAARHGDAQGGVGAAQPSHRLATLARGHVGHGAGVHNGPIGSGRVVHHAEAGGEGAAGQVLDLRLVQFAA